MTSTPLRLHNLLMIRLGRPCRPSLQPIHRPTGLSMPRYVPIRQKSDDSIFEAWRGTSDKDHASPRAEAGEDTDPQTGGAKTGFTEREDKFGNPESDLPQGVTERQGSKFAKKEKREHPKAPEPLIGMNDERGRKGN